MDILDKQFKIKKFLKTVFRDIDFAKEKIRVFQNNKDNTFNKVNYFYDIDELVSFSTNKSNYNLNTYFQLATLHTDAEDGKEENLKYRYCLSFDFDKKDLGEGFNHKDIVNRFKELKIYCHCIIDSGNGYHAYIVLNKTADIDKVNEVQKALCKRLGADRNAIKKTQILRIPYTYNVKGDKAKTVRIVHLADKHSKLFKPYDINFLYRKNCNKADIIRNDTTIKYTLNNTNVPKCIQNILQNGSEEGNRYKDLQNIVVALRQHNKDLGIIKEICKEWAFKSNYDDSLEYRVENIYNNKTSLELNCSDCLEFNNCYSKVVSDFNFDNLTDENGIICNTYNLDDKIIKKIKNKQNRGGKVLSGNEVLILNVLKNEHEHPRPLTKDGMDIKLLTNSITYKKKCRLSDKTLRETLDNLVKNKYVTVDIGARGKKYYKFNHIRSKVDNNIKISYFATIMCICGNITPSELSLYVLLRYIHRQQQLQGIAKGNILQINQDEIAKAYYGDSNKENNQSNISVMINNLIECKILEIYNKEQSKNNGYDYNIYRLNS